MRDDEQSIVNHMTDNISSISLEYAICDIKQLKKSRSWSALSPSQNCKSQSVHSISGAFFANNDIRRKNLLPFASDQKNVNSSDPSHIRDSNLVDENLKRNVLSVTGCEMCANYEIKMQQLQDNEKRLRQQLVSNQSVMENLKTELTSEKTLRSGNEQKFADMNVEFSNELQSLRQLLHNFDSKFQQNEQLFGGKLQDCTQKFKESTTRSKILKSKMEGVQNRYENLLGKHRTPVDAMTREAIDLPQTVEELHVYCLRLREELIEAKIAKDHLEETLKSELLFAKDQIKSEQQSKEQLEATLSDEVNTLRTELGVAKSHLEETEHLRKLCDERDRQIDEHRLTINDLESALSQIKTERNKTENLYHDCKQRSSILQHELDNSEQVQRDFVRLSQSLQIELESIRQADHQVRWQHEDDVFMCSGCKVPFSKHRRKIHCNHCGKIFCETCLTKSAPQGPMKRPATVCDVCHTLLVHDTSPYFAHTVPNSVPSA